MYLRDLDNNLDGVADDDWTAYVEVRTHERDAGSVQDVRLDYETLSQGVRESAGNQPTWVSRRFALPSIPKQRLIEAAKGDESDQVALGDRSGIRPKGHPLRHFLPSSTMYQRNGIKSVVIRHR